MTPVRICCYAGTLTRLGVSKANVQTLLSTISPTKDGRWGGGVAGFVKVEDFPFTEMAWLYRGMLVLRGKVQETSKSSGMLALVELDTCPFYVTFRRVKPNQKSPSISIHALQGPPVFLFSRYDFGEFLRILDADTTATEASEKHQEGWCCVFLLVTGCICM